MSDQHFLNTLFDVARNVTPVANARIAAAIVHKGRIVSIGTNLLKSHPIQKQFGKNSEAIFLHAEINAIVQAKKSLSKEEFNKSTLYVARAKRKGQGKGFIKGKACPCEGCQRALESFGIGRVVWTTDD